jgi:hypothetical protein
MKLGTKAILGLGALFLLSKRAGAGSTTASSSNIVIPKGGEILNIDELRALARSVGFPEQSVDTAAAVAMAESGGYPAAVGDQGKSFGLWQIHHPSHPTYEPAMLLTPSYNAQAALAISEQGKKWQPWTTYRNGAYQKFMPKAPAALAAAAPIAGELEEPPPVVASASVLEDSPEEPDTEVTAAPQPERET